MKKIVNISVMCIFTAIFAYLFFGNLKGLIDFFKNISHINADYFYDYGRSVLMPLFGLGGLITSVILLISACLNKTKRLDRRIGSLIALLISGFFFSEVISTIPAAIAHNSISVLSSSTFIKYYLLFAFDLVASIGLILRKTKLIRAIVTSVGLAGILIIDILLMSEMNFSLDFIKYLSGSFHIYIFMIIGCIAVGAYVWLGGEDKEIE